MEDKEANNLLILSLLFDLSSKNYQIILLILK